MAEPSTAIKKCDGARCDSAYQDEKYGKDNRVCNFALAQNGKSGGYRCTVCGKVHSK